MKTFVLSCAAWLTVVAGVTIALDGATRWLVAVPLVAAGLGGIVSELGAYRERVRARITVPETSSDESPEQPPDTPDWGLSLLVDADEAAGTLNPSVQITGPRVPEQAIIHLDVVDGHGVVRLTTERWPQHPDMGVDLTLETLALPADARTDDAVRWDWRITLRDGDEELVRQSGPLAGAGCLNDEAELEVLDLPEPSRAAPTTDRETLLELLARRAAAS